MHQDQELPLVLESASLMDSILEMSSKKLGCTIVEDADGRLMGIITDGDLRRHIQQKQQNILSYAAKDCMTANPKACLPDDLAVSALNLMEQFSITMLPVIDAQGKAAGLLHMHDLIRAGVV
jgi:arabinose-5-phosphate isomerase